MKAAFSVLVVLLVLFQTAFCRPSSRSKWDNCLDDLKTNLQEHVEDLGEWGQAFILRIAVTRELLDQGRELCDKFLVNDPPTYFEEYFFNLCIEENDELSKQESNRIRCELEAKAAEQPELLKGYLIEFTRCLLPWTRSSTKNSDCSTFGKFFKKDCKKNLNSYVKPGKESED